MDNIDYFGGDFLNLSYLGNMQACFAVDEFNCEWRIESLGIKENPFMVYILNNFINDYNI